MSARRQFRAAGVTFVDGYPSNLQRLHEIHEMAIDADVCLSVTLIRNPDNQYDANAIEVHVPSLGVDAMVGHVPKELASKMAPVMDDGTPVAAEVVEVVIDPWHPDKPGLAVDAWRAEP